MSTRIPNVYTRVQSENRVDIVVTNRNKIACLPIIGLHLLLSTGIPNVYSKVRTENRKMNVMTGTHTLNCTRARSLSSWIPACMAMNAHSPDLGVAVGKHKRWCDLNLTRMV